MDKSNEGWQTPTAKKLRDVKASFEEVVKEIVRRDLESIQRLKTLMEWKSRYDLVKKHNSDTDPS